VGATLVVARGRSWYVLPDRGPIRAFEPGPGNGADAAPAVPRALVEALAGPGRSTPVVAGGVALAEALTRTLHRPVARADAAMWHRALERLPTPEPDAERRYTLERARADLEAALRSPEEVLVTLAREEERLERALGREERASEAFVALTGTVLAEYADRWRRSRGSLAEHHRDLLVRLEGEARRTVPNLSAVVGARTAARLVAAAGGATPLARVSASRLQLLGSRRRPSAERGPRFGAIVLAEGSERVPADRRGAYARSLAALAAIAVRADVLTHGDVAPELVRRREARAARLRRRGT
jgi:hypothetical protein